MKRMVSEKIESYCFKKRVIPKTSYKIVVSEKIEFYYFKKRLHSLKIFP